MYIYWWSNGDKHDFHHMQLPNLHNFTWGFISNFNKCGVTLRKDISFLDRIAQCLWAGWFWSTSGLQYFMANATILPIFRHFLLDYGLLDTMQYVCCHHGVQESWMCCAVNRLCLAYIWHLPTTKAENVEQ